MRALARRCRKWRRAMLWAFAAYAIFLCLWDMGDLKADSGATPATAGASTAAQTSDATSAASAAACERRRALQYKLDCWTRAGGRWEWEESRASLDAFHISPNDGQRRELFYWIPADGCPAAPLLYFNRTHFCEVLRGKNIFFLGDSMTRTFHVGAVAMASDGRRINTTNFLNIFDHSICEDSPFGASHVPQLHTGHLKNGFSKSWRGVR